MNRNNDYQIERLLRLASAKGLIKQEDIIPARNGLLDLLCVKEPFQTSSEEIVLENNVGAADILEIILDNCVNEGIISEDTVTLRDLFAAKIMGLLMPRASEVSERFQALYKRNPEAATDYFYKLCQDSNYIQMDRINKNLYWEAETEFGALEITVNLSKPEKDPKEIAAAKLLPQTGYPKCLLCAENAGFAGNLNHPARQNLRLIPMQLGRIEKEQWFFQYSPYVYYNEHCIVLNEKHVPMKISRATFERLFDFVSQLPHYFIGSNADLPIVGGSILNHDHFQGGRHIFPMEKAETYAEYRYDKHEDIKISLVKWPMSAIRLSCTEKNTDTNALIELSMHILETWKQYSDESAEIRAFSGNTPHNTVTPIVRINAGGYGEIDIVLRNNRTTEQYPLGIFHPHENLHHIKKENIGLIEVMGLAVLPGRLSVSLDEIANILSGQNTFDPDLIDSSHALYSHRLWIKELLAKYGVSNDTDEAKQIVKVEVGEVFKQVLCDAGVFKFTDDGKKQFDRFMKACGFVM